MRSHHGEIAFSGRATLGEGPTWDPAAAHLLWVDILPGEVHAFDPATGVDQVILRPGQHVGAAKPRRGGGHVVNLRDGIGVYDPDGAFRMVAEVGKPGRRGNDAAVDPHGALWAGTMRYDEARGGGALYRLDPDHRLDVIRDDVTISNGIGWSPDGRRMYYVDTPTRQIEALDLDDGGMPVSSAAFVEVDGFPDGLTVDVDGCVWVALWEGGAVNRYTPDGRLDLVVPLPTPRVTACAFGGKDLRDLYVTSAEADHGPGGAMFVLPGIGQGTPATPFSG